MKILHLGKYYAPYRGGMETVLQNLAEGLLDAGHEVTVLVAAADGLDTRETVYGPRTGARGRLVRCGALGRFNSQPLTASLYPLLRHEVARLEPDIVHVHLPNPLGAAVWRLPGSWRRPGGPVLAVWHHADVTRQKLGGRLVRPLLRRFLAAADGISVSSRNLAEGSTELAGLRDRVEVVPFGIEARPWIRIEARRDGPFLFLGRLVGYKGLHVLLEAMRRVPQADLVIVGEGPLEEDLREEIRGADLARRVSMVGRLEMPDLVRLMERARALVLPSIDTSETFGLVQLEAMAAAVPVIATDLPTGVREVCVPGRTGTLVRPGDVDGLAAALREFEADAGLRERLGQGGRERFRKEYTRERMIDQLVPWYERLMARRGAEALR